MKGYLEKLCDVKINKVWAEMENRDAKSKIEVGRNVGENRLDVEKLPH